MGEFEIIWSPKAEKEFASNLEYLENNWSYKFILNYLDRVEEVLNNIYENPKMYMCIDKKRKIHKCVLNKQIVLYYRINYIF